MTLNLIPLLLICSLVSTVSTSAEYDPLMGFLLSAGGPSWGIGGNLTAIQIDEMIGPSGDTSYVAGGIMFSGIYSDYYRTGGMEKPGASYFRRFRGSAFLTGYSHFGWGLRVRNSNYLLQYSLLNRPREQSISLKDFQSNNLIDGMISYKNIRLNAGFITHPSNSLQPFMAIQGDFPLNSAIEIQWQRRFIQSELSSIWHEELAEIELRAQREGFAGRFVSPHAGPIHAELAFNYFDFIRRSSRNELAQFEPYGDQFGFHFFMMLDLSRWKGAVGFRNQELGIGAYGFKGDFSFAKITDFSLDVRTIFVSLQANPDMYFSKVIYEFESLWWKGNSRGHIEFWPFTSGLVDLLGFRRYYKAGSSGNINRFHFGGEKRSSEKLTFQGGLNILDIKPSGVIEHWRPAVLLFGKEDEQTHSINLLRTLISTFHFSLKYQRLDWQLEYEFTQIIPLKAWYRTSSEVEPPSEVKSKGRVYGGGFHILTINRFFLFSDFQRRLHDNY